MKPNLICITNEKKREEEKMKQKEKMKFFKPTTEMLALFEV